MDKPESCIKHTLDKVPMYKIIVDITFIN
jgi:hypothetical protein